MRSLAPMRFPSSARGVTIIEAVICVFVMSVALTAGLAVTGTLGAGRLAMVERVEGQSLAEELMVEIRAMPYDGIDQPIVDLSTGIPRSGATPPADRSAFDDLDDYAGWVGSPPEAKDGTAIAGYAGWSRRVDMFWLEADGSRSLVDTGRILVVVTVQRGDRRAARLETIRTRARDQFASGGGGS